MVYSGFMEVYKVAPFSRFESIPSIPSISLNPINLPQSYLTSALIIPY